MTKCDYCGGQHHHEHCPNCGAPTMIEPLPLLALCGTLPLYDVRDYQKLMRAAMGIPAHYFEDGPPVPKGGPPRRPQDVIFR